MPGGRWPCSTGINQSSGFDQMILRISLIISDQKLDQMETDINNFNIRVYAIIMKDSYYVLISDEYMMVMEMTKFPGGGLRFGEGPADCLRREAMAEFSQEIEKKRDRRSDFPY